MRGDRRRGVNRVPSAPPSCVDQLEIHATYLHVNGFRKLAAKHVFCSLPWTPRDTGRGVLQPLPAIPPTPGSGTLVTTAEQGVACARDGDQQNGRNAAAEKTKPGRVLSLRATAGQGPGSRSLASAQMPTSKMTVTPGPKPSVYGERTLPHLRRRPRRRAVHGRDQERVTCLAGATNG